MEEQAVASVSPSRAAWSRLQRTQSGLKKAATECHKIEEFFTTKDTRTLVQENNNLQLQLQMLQKTVEQNPGKPKPASRASYLLECLLAAEESNKHKKNRGNRYDEQMKQISRYIFQIGGPKSYNFFKLNLPNAVPSITSLKRVLASSGDVPVEGQFRFSELREFLELRGCPMQVCISEDATRVQQRVQYNRATNQLVGHVPVLDANGLPTVGQFPALSAAGIRKHFQENSCSSNAYILVAKPLTDSSPNFILSLFGTNNKFSALHVERRWEWMCREAAAHGIQIRGFSSDGDSKLLSAMQKLTFSQSKRTNNWDWFEGSFSDPVCVQDHIHIATKLANRLEKPSIVLPMGNYVASPSHVRELIETKSKDQHNLCMSDIAGNDKMNYRSVEKLCERNVTKLLSSCLGSEATITYLDMIREVVSSFTDKSLQPLSRVLLIWKWIFFLRIWRSWLMSEGYNLKENFLTSNCYMCIEINGHALISLILHFRKSDEPNLFLPWNFCSQPCEQVFRTARSMTSTESTVINFSILEFLHRIRRIEVQSEVELKYGDKFKFPTSHRQSKKTQEASFIPKFLPSNRDILNTIKEAKTEAISRAASLGMKFKSVPKSFLHNDRLQREEEMDNDSASDVDDNSTDESIDTHNGLIDEEEDVVEDLCVVSTGPLGVKTFEDVDLSPTSIYVQVLGGNGEMHIIKKTTLCYLFSEKGCKLSADRLLRVQAPAVGVNRQLHDGDQEQKARREENVNLEDWCAFFTPDREAYRVGRVISFAYLSGTSDRSLQYSLPSAPVTAPAKSTKRGIGCLCSWYKVNKKRQLCQDINVSHGYYNISNYICTLPRPNCRDNSFNYSKDVVTSIGNILSSLDD